MITDIGGVEILRGVAMIHFHQGVDLKVAVRMKSSGFKNKLRKKKGRQQVKTDLLR